VLLSIKEKLQMALVTKLFEHSAPAGDFGLSQNEPNPFKKLTTIKINLPYQTKVTVLITNSYGKVVDKLISSVRDAGTYQLEFFADGLSRGTYFCHLVADNYSYSQEMELIK
jgi:hypothetical protein